MPRITPCRNTITDRFPVASFVVEVPPDRLFEIACATDPALFRGDRRQQRTPANFFTTRGAGLLRAPAGQATYLMPPEQLLRFAGQRRVYFTLGCYGGPRGDQGDFTTPPDRAEEAPYLSLSPDFTGRPLDRNRLRARQQDPRYGGPGAPLAWGGDRVPLGGAAGDAYDDGYPADLWQARTTGPDRADPTDPQDPADPPGPEPRDAGVESYGAGPEPDGLEDAPALRAAGAAAPAPLRSSSPSPERHQASPTVRSASARSPAYGRRGEVEPAGFEDATALRRACGPVGGPVAGAEPAGFEDARDLARGAPGARFGDASASDFQAVREEAEPRGVDDAYEEQLGPDPEGDLPAPSPGAAALDAEGPRPLTIEEKYRLILPVAAFQSGAERTSAVNADTEFSDPRHPAYQRYHIGLSWGLVQVTQRGGALGRTLRACHRRSPARFAEVFGPASAELLAVTTAPTEEERVQPVDGAFLWEEQWVGRFREAGAVPEFQAAQNEIAIEDYLDANLPFAAALGFDTDRALAMLYDRCVHMGNGGGRRWVVSAVSPIQDDATRARALAAVEAPDVRALQGRLGLRVDGAFGPKTHAGLIAELRRRGPAAGVPVPALPAMLDRMVAAARGRRFERRIATLRTTGELTDTRRLVP